MPDASSQMPGASRVGNRKVRGSARSGWEQVVYRHKLLYGRVCLPEHPQGVPYNCSIIVFCNG